MIARSACLTLAALLSAACATHTVNAPPSPRPAASEARVAPAPVAAAEPEVSPEPAAAEGTLRGRILEVLDAAPYVYLRLATRTGEAWAAVSAFTARVGDELVVSGAMRMVDFESKVLRRKFDVLFFGTVGAEEPTSQPAPPPAPKDEPIAPATGREARTVAQLWAERASLAGASVVVRGKVVKANADVMASNWYHLRDGTGTPAERNNDLTVLTPAGDPLVSVGDVVTVRGTVALEKDFGAGYSYPVILVDAKVVE